MRASVSPGKITHTHSQRGGTSAVYSGPPRHLIGEKWFISTDVLSWLADEHNWPGHVLHLSHSSYLHCVYYVCIEPAYIHVCLLIHVCVWQKWKAFCYLLIRFRAQRVWSLSHDNLPDLYQTCRKTEESEPSHHTNNTYTEAKSPKLNGNNQNATLRRAISITGENCLCGCLRHVCTQKCLHACLFCSAQYMSYWVEVWWNTLIWFMEFRLYQPYEVAETPGANSSQSNKL